jgi:hypothetical protein
LVFRSCLIWSMKALSAGCITRSNACFTVSIWGPGGGHATNLFRSPTRSSPRPVLHSGPSRCGSKRYFSVVYGKLDSSGNGASTRTIDFRSIWRSAAAPRSSRAGARTRRTWPSPFTIAATPMRRSAITPAPSPISLRPYSSTRGTPMPLTTAATPAAASRITTAR